MLYVYGIVDACRFEVVRGEGHDGCDVVPVAAGRLAAAVSHLAAGAVEPSPTCVWRHERVLGRLMQANAVLPLRFGTTCRDADVLRDRLAQSAAALAKDLDHVRGKVEMALRVIEGGAPGVSNAPGSDQESGPGAAYLRTRVRLRHDRLVRDAAGKQIAQLLRCRLHASSSELACVVPPAGSPGFRVSCLVERDKLPAFAEALDLFRQHYPQFDVTCTGPWAPYSFVAASDLRGGNRGDQGM